MKTALLTRAATFAEVNDAFRWQIPQAYNMAWDVCDRHAAGPDKLALIHHTADGVRTYTFRDVQRIANQLANTLTAFGLMRGDRVMLYLPQHPVTAIGHIACWKAGLVSMPTSILFWG